MIDVVARECVNHVFVTDFRAARVIDIRGLRETNLEIDLHG